MKDRHIGWALVPALLHAAAASGGGWIEFNEQTAQRLITDDPAVGAGDTQEKDYAWGDVDADGDTDLVVVRKSPFTTAGGRRNVLFLNEGTAEGHAIDGVLVDRTAQYIPGFLDLTNDRDVILADVNGDGRPDIVTAVTLGGVEAPKAITHPRVYINLGDDAQGSWQGFAFDDVDRIPTFPFEPRFNAVAAGDVDNDGDLDLYFGDSDSGPYSRGGDLDDRLLANNGTGYFTDVTAAALAGLEDSSFSVSAAITDLNLDGFPDIVRSDLVLHVVRITYNTGDGMFDAIETVYDIAALAFTIGNLNDDGLPDLAVSDEVVDRYLLHQGNGPDGLADFSVTSFPSVTNGFGEDVVISDLDGDGLQDVVIADVDMDLPGCTRTTHVLHNTGTLSTPSFVADAGNIPQSMRTGCHDVAVLDLDRDGLLDLVFGRCTGTQIWVQRPVLVIEFAYPGGLPEMLQPEVPAQFEVLLAPSGAPIEPGSPAIHVSIDGGPFVAEPLDPVGQDLYLATLPALACLQRVDWYASASLEGGVLFTDPPDAPLSTYGAVAAAGTQVVFSDSIEGDVSGWTIVSDPSLTSGEWEQADPNGTFSGADGAAPEDDATPEGTMAFVTENGPPGGAANANDVDGGPTYLLTPVFDLEDADAIVSYNRWFVSIFAVPDALTVEISNDGGATWVPVETVTGADDSWRSHSFVVSSLLEPSSEVRLRFGVCDCPNESVTEAGLDDFQVLRFLCPCLWDVDSSGLVGITDLFALLAAWGTDPGGPPDFDGDGNVGVSDLLALLANWGPCR